MKKLEIFDAVDQFPEIWSVSQIAQMINQVCERSFPFVWVSGELSTMTQASSGHWYFSIKDEAAQLRCVMFRNAAKRISFKPKLGDSIEIYAAVSFYQLRGELQLTVDMIRPKGQGKFFEEFLRIKGLLASEGLFEEARKLAIPKYPSVIGIVTSAQAAALQDVLITIGRRAPHVKTIHYDAPVQGHSAAGKLAIQIERACREGLADVLILARGGGSVEDLWAFNDEHLARVIGVSSIPIITGIGHEIDFTIADFVADYRAATPTAAAEMASPDRQLELEHLRNIGVRMRKHVSRSLQDQQQLLDWASQKFKNSLYPLDLAKITLVERRVRFSNLARNLVISHRQLMKVLEHRLSVVLLPPKAFHQVLGECYRRALWVGNLTISKYQGRLELSKQRLDLLNPHQILKRGYTFITSADGDKVMRRANNLKNGMPIKIYFLDGSAGACVDLIELD